MNPWEEYQAQPAPVEEAGPWQEYGGAQVQGDIVENKMPEGFKGRFVAKNLAGSPEAAFNYLQKENPDFEIKKDKSGEIIARKRGSTTWGKMDPVGFDWRDLTDIAYDVPAAIAEGAATAAGGIAGAIAGAPTVVGAPAAALAGGALAGSAAGAGTEALRQGLGRLAGIEDNFNPASIGKNAAFGVASPLLLGTGGTAKQALKAYGPELAEQIAKSQRGLLGMGYDKAAETIFPQIGSLVGGYTPDVLKSAYKNLERIKKSEKSPELVTEFIESSKDTINDSIQTARRQVGQELGDISSQIDEVVGAGAINTQSILEPLIKFREEVASKGIQSEARKQTASQIDDIIAKYFTVTNEAGEESIPLALSVADANIIRTQLKDLSSDLGMNFKNIGTTKSVNQAGAVDKKLLNTLTSVDSTIRKNIDTVANEAAPDLARRVKELSGEYSELIDMSDEFFNATKNEASFERFLKKKGAASEVARKRLSDVSGENVQQLATDIDAINLFRNPSSIIPSFGGSNTARTLGLGTAGAYAGSVAGQSMGSGTYLPTIIGAGLGSLAGSPKAIRRYMQLNKGARNMGQSEAYKFMPYMLMNASQDQSGGNK